MGFFDFLKFGSKKPSFDLRDYKFISDNHLRLENLQQVDVDNKGSWRGIWIQSKDNLIFNVTIYNLTGNHPVWVDNIQMATKIMKFVEETDMRISLRGFGNDSMGASFSDYGISLYKFEQDINSIHLCMYDRNITIAYMKGDPAKMNMRTEFNRTPLNVNIDSFNKLIKFKKSWESDMNSQEKMLIAKNSDKLNNIGCDFYDNDNYEEAIKYFNKALEIMPINDDALKNLKICYKYQKNQKKVVEIEKMLSYLQD